MSEHQHIIRLQAENIKRLKAVRIDAAGQHVVRITGRNASGKSSCLDAIMWALGGADHIQSRPIRKGEDRAAIELELDDDLIVRRRFTAKSSYLEVLSKGEKVRSPQAVLDRLVGKLSFDPAAFQREPAARQLSILQELTGVDVRDEDRREKELYDERREVGREEKRLQAAADEAEAAVPEGAPAQPVDAEKVMAEVNRRITYNEQLARTRARREQEIGAAQQRVDAQAETCERLERDIEETKARLARLQSELGHARAGGDDAQEELAELRRLPPIEGELDVDEAMKKVRQVQAINEAYRARKSAQEARERYQAVKDAARNLNDALEAVRARRKAKIAAAKMPVEGLDFGEGYVAYNGLPLEQASQAEQLRVSMAMAMAMNPKLRVIRITDASLLDTDSMRMVEELAREHDYQVWLEVVDESGQIGVYIEDGEVAAVNGAPVPKVPSVEGKDAAAGGKDAPVPIEQEVMARAKAAAAKHFGPAGPVHTEAEASGAGEEDFADDDIDAIFGSLTKQRAELGE